jgi:hypothetical protein
MRYGALALIIGAALTASIDTASAINCGPGMNSDGYRCFPAWQRQEYGGYGGGGYYRRGYGRRVVDCGPGMNSDGYRCFPIGARRSRGGGCYGPTGVYDPRGC